MLSLFRSSSRHSRTSPPHTPPKTRLSLEQLEMRALLSVTAAPLDVSNSTGPQSEVSIAVNPSNPNQLVAASNDVAYGKPIKVYYSADRAPAGPVRRASG